MKKIIFFYTIILGHGNDVTSCEWHPFKALIASVSKDHSLKLWDPMNGEELATVYILLIYL